MNRFALGTAQFGNPYSIANQEGPVSRLIAKDILHAAAIHGIDTIDTAIAYGDSEIYLGEAGTKNFKVVTKLPEVPESRADIRAWIKDQIDGSLARLQISSVYGLLLHQPYQLLKSNGKLIYKVLQELKETEQIQKIGISIYSPNELDAITENYRLDLVQAPFNLVDRRLHTSGWLQQLKHAKIEIHTRSAFLQGLLLLPKTALPKKFGAWSHLWNQWHDWLDHYTVPAVQASLAYPLSFPGIDRIVVGTDNVKQLEQIMRLESGFPIPELPNLECNEENLINPSKWVNL